MSQKMASRRTMLLIALLGLALAGLALCLNRALNGDLYLLLFSGRYVAHHGPVSHDPFPTIEHGQEWLNQQWLAEVVFYGAERVVGVVGITVLYAVLLALPLAVVLAMIRRQGELAMLAVTALYVPGIGAIIHPRAAGFTLLLFSVLAAGIVGAWGLGSGGRAPSRSPVWALAGIPLAFALWANLHGGFIAGLLLVGAVAAGLAIDRRRGLATPPPARIAVLAATGALGALLATFATPLGPEIWSYIASFRNSALKLASTEWEPALTSVPATLYLVAAAGIGALTWRAAPRPRAVMPVLVAAAFIAFAAASMRNLIFVAPAIATQIACSAPDAARAPRRVVLGAAAVAAVAAFAVYAVLGTPNSERVGNPAVRYAIEHPPERGRIVAYAGPSSYILWNAPRTRVVINGWLEHFSPAQLRANFGILHGARADPTRWVERVDAGAVIAYIPQAIRRLERHDFEVELRGPNGTYLVREGIAPRHP